MRQAGRYLPEYREIRARARDFLDLCYAPALAAEVTLQPVRRFGFDAAILFADILLIPHALGQGLRFAEGEGPVLDPITSGTALVGLKPDAVAARLSPIMETVERVRTALPQETALIGFAGAPWTVATYMAEGHGSTEQKAAKIWSYRDPESFEALIDILVEATSRYLLAQIAAGVQVVQLFESWAASLDDKSFTRWSIAPTRRIVEAIKAVHPNVPVIGFPRGAGTKIKAYVEGTGVDAVSVDFGTPMGALADAVGPRTILQGNLDPIRLVAGGTALETGVRDILEGMGERPFVFNLGHGIVPETPLEHVSALIAQIRAHR
jgi:uroporphyrinogen decarboxylase